MKKMICLAVSMLVLAGLAAPAAEQSPPAVVSVPSEMKRVVLVRLKYNTDLLEGLRQAVKDEKITNAVILSGVGSVTRFHVHAVSNTTLPAKLAFGGHLHEGTTVFTFAVITLGVLDDNADLGRFDDSNWR